MLLLVFRHIQTHHCVFITEEEPGKSFRQLGLADTGRSQEHETAYRSLRVFEPGAASPDSLRNSLYRFFLVDEPLVDALLHMNQLFGFALEHLGYRYTRPAGDKQGDIFFTNLFFNFLVL